MKRIPIVFFLFSFKQQVPRDQELTPSPAVSSDNSVFDSDVVGESEWVIPYHEVSFGKRLMGAGSLSAGHEIYQGRWHGDVTIHKFRNSQRLKKTHSCLSNK